MREVLSSLVRLARRAPQRIAISSQEGTLSRAGLCHAVARLMQELAGTPAVTGLLMSRSAGWIAADLALAALGRTVVPLPDFFSPGQWQHMIADAGLSLVVTDEAMAARLQGLPVRCLVVRGLETGGAEGRQCSPDTGLDTGHPDLALPENLLAGGGGAGGGASSRESRRIIYTSGTSGQPKGVILGERAMTASLRALQQAVQAGEDDLHLSVLPFSLLLEQLAGILLPLQAGAQIHLLSSPQNLIREAAAVRPTTTILVPALLEGWLAGLRQAGQHQAPSSLRLAAVGGAPVGTALATAARAAGFPLCEGYGLSECCSVVAVNRPGNPRPGTVGLPLDGVSVSIEEGEIVVRGPTVMEGYLGGNLAGSKPDGVWRTGDMGYLTDGGELVVLGRKDDVVVTDGGRNVHPEWIEPMLLADPRIRLAAVIAGRHGLHAVIVVAPPFPDSGSPDSGSPDGGDSSRLFWQQRLQALTAEAPAYARPAARPEELTILLPGEPRLAGWFTADGRPRRRRISQDLMVTAETEDLFAMRTA